MENDKIDEWLEATDHDRPWLAAELGVSAGTLYNWFSKGFPVWGEKAISRLMNPPGSEDAGLEVSFTARQFERIEQARQLVGLKRKDFYETAITELTDKILTEEQKESQQGQRPTIKYTEAVEQLGSRHHGVNESEPIQSAADLRKILKKHGGSGTSSGL